MSGAAEVPALFGARGVSWAVGPISVLSPRVQNQALPPFSLTVADTLSTQALGYDYAAATAHVIGPTP